MKKEYYLISLTKNIFRNFYNHPFICIIIPFYPCLIYEECFANCQLNSKTKLQNNKCCEEELIIYSREKSYDDPNNHFFNKSYINGGHTDYFKDYYNSDSTDSWTDIGNEYFIGSYYDERETSMMRP
jgi:hypothetical protein